MTQENKTRLQELSEELANEATWLADISVGHPDDTNSLWTLIDMMARGEFDSDLADELAVLLSAAHATLEEAIEEAEAVPALKLVGEEE